jgi:hypothetical protein
MRRGLMVLLVVVVIGGGVSALVAGCGDGGAKAQVVPLDQVPEPLVRKAQETLPEIKFDHARKLPNGNYEVRGKAKNGKVREVEMKPSGEVIEIE